MEKFTLINKDRSRIKYLNHLKIYQNLRYKTFMKKEGIKTIVVEKDKLKNNKSFLCKTENLIRVSRNIFLEKKLEVDFCKLK